MNHRERRGAQRGVGKKMDEMNEKAPAIQLPRRTREILEAKLREQATLQALLQQQGQAINELVEAAREMLDVPAGWELANTAIGFVAPAKDEGMSRAPADN